MTPSLSHTVRSEEEEVLGVGSGLGALVGDDVVVLVKELVIWVDSVADVVVDCVEWAVGVVEGLSCVFAECGEGVETGSFGNEEACWDA